MRRIAPALAVGCGLIGVVLLYGLGGRAIADRLLLGWGVLPFETPFLDADTVLSALRCLRRGVDVFESNPCDPLGRLYDYSPLWLHAAALPVQESWTMPIGLGVDALFVLSLLLLPAGRSWPCVLAIGLGVLSTAVAYALERANNDLLIFVLAAAATNLSVRRPGLRALGYALAFLAGLLKYYPMVLMELAARERPGRLVAIAGLAVMGLAAFVALEFAPLVRALALIPSGELFGDMFGAKTLAHGIRQQMGWPELAAQLGTALLTVAAMLLGAGLAWRGRLGAALGQLRPLERAALFAGCLLILGCFSTAQNIGYRAIHLILMLPALTALAGGTTARRFWAPTAAVVLMLLWSDGWRHWVDAGSFGKPIWAYLEWKVPTRTQLAAWGLRELGWWWVVSVSWGVVFATLTASPIGQALLTRPRRSPVRVPAPSPPRLPQGR